MLVLSRLLRRSVVRPVESLRAAMQQVEGGDYAARVAPSGAGEIRTLVGGFNDMATLVEAQRDRLQALAESDPLTGLANHRRFHQALEDTIGAARSAAVVVLDLDHFKFLNDTRGHPYGDQVLREVAAKLREAVRGAHDLVGRLGGEEFGILLADVDAEEAFRVAERARGLIRGLPIDGFSLDCSAGVAAWPTDTDSPRACSTSPTPRSTRPSAWAAGRRGAWTPTRARRRSTSSARRCASCSTTRARHARLPADHRPRDGARRGLRGPLALPGRGRPAARRVVRPRAPLRARPAAAGARAAADGRGARAAEPHLAVAEPRRGRARDRRRPGRAARGPERDRDRDHRAGAAARRRGAAADPRRPARAGREDRARRRRRRLRGPAARGRIRPDIIKLDRSLVRASTPTPSGSR